MVLDLLTLLLGMLVIGFTECAVFTVLGWAYHRYGEETELGPLNFDRADQESFRKYMGLLVVLIGIPTVAIHLIGFFFRQWWLAPSGYWYALFLLAALQFGFLAYMIPIQFPNIEQRRANILAALNTGAYVILYFIVIGRLLR